MWQSDKLNMTIIIIIHNNPTYDDTSETSQQKMLIDIKDLDKHDKDMTSSYISVLVHC
jgi:hypothetical protein